MEALSGRGPAGVLSTMCLLEPENHLGQAMLRTQAQEAVPRQSLWADLVLALVSFQSFCLTVWDLLGLQWSGGATKSVEGDVKPAVDVSVDGMVFVADFLWG